MSVPLGGTCDERFRPVRDRFAELLADGSETGAAVCVHVGGEPVVDLWGGWSDAARTTPWSRDTTAATYSVTKAPAAAAVKPRCRRTPMPFCRMGIVPSLMASRASGISIMTRLGLGSFSRE